MKRLILAALVCAAGKVGADGHENCYIFDDNETRLGCYDTVFGRLEDKQSKEDSTESTKSKLVVTSEKSKFKDTTDVFIPLTSNEDILCRSFGAPQPIRLLLRCQENTTTLLLTGDCHLTGGHGGYGRVEIRLDDEKCFVSNLEESTSNRALGLWNGKNLSLLLRICSKKTLLFFA